MLDSLDDNSKMSAVVVSENGSASVVRVERPEIGPAEVLVRVARAGICGTDLHILSGEYPLARFPLTLGHELSGTVEAVGKDVRTIAVGDRVTVDPNIPCMACTECKRKAFNQCENLSIIGVNRAGAFADYVAAPEEAVYQIGTLPFDQAALVEPLACVVWGLQRVRPSPGDTVLIFGAGPMGCLLLQALRAAGGVRAAIVDVSQIRLELAKELGADLAILPEDMALLDTFAPRGFEIVVDATGVPSVLKGAFERVRNGGTVWVFGVAPEGATVGIEPYEFFRRDLSMIGSFALNKTFQEAIALASSGAVQLAPLVSHVLPLSQFGEGIRIAREDPSRMKVQFSFGAGE